MPNHETGTGSPLDETPTQYRADRRDASPTIQIRKTAGRCRAIPTEEEQPLPSFDRRAAEPSAEAQEEAMKLARDLYKDELAKARTPEEKQALAKKILDQAEAAANADAGTFVLFRLARDISAQALDGADGVCGR